MIGLLLITWRIRKKSVKLLNTSLWSMFNESFPLVRVRVSSRDPPYMSPLVKHLCKVRNKTAHRGNQAEKIIRQERINALIRMNQVNAVNNERLKHNRGSKGWWDTANRITGRKTQGALVSSVISPDVINTYFQTINTDDEYEAPTRLQIPAGTRLPTVNECDVRNLLSHLKRTASGPRGGTRYIPGWGGAARPLIP